MNAHLDLTMVERIAAEIRSALGGDDDDTAFLDTLDGETNALDALDHLITTSAEASAMAEAIKSQEADLRARRGRMEAREAACRVGMLQILDAIGMKKVERPLATISRRAGIASVQITDEASIPTQLCKVVSTPDKAAIKAQLMAGEIVPGAQLSIGDDGVTVRAR